MMNIKNKEVVLINRDEKQNIYIENKMDRI